MALILASGSPRRKELLQQIGCAFQVAVSQFEEDNSLALPPVELAVYHAREKALACLQNAQAEDIIIGADTIVVLNGRVYGKPIDITDGRRMLMELSGREHQVITGVAVVTPGGVWYDNAVTKVLFRQLAPEQIERYLDTGEWVDKAGGYGIQGRGALLVESIEGCYNNVVGLPLTTLDALMKKAAGVGLL
ncbi:MAG: Septum formation protein Maf [Firmicutes bacterium]|nr:Septum formation protein Maf [Bacillota bacterium]